MVKANSFNFKKILPHLIATAVFVVLSGIYTLPVFENKTLAQNDILQGQYAGEELKKNYEETGDVSMWTNSMFSGMPAYFIWLKTDSPTLKASYLVNGIFPSAMSVIFMLLLSYYIALAALKFDPYISVLGAIAFTFTSFNIISLEAGHLYKIRAIAYAAPIFSATILLYQKKYFPGSILLIVFSILECFSNHVQITYYLYIAIGTYAIYALVKAIKEKELKHFFIASSIIAIVNILSIGSMASRFWTAYEYSKYTMRGNAELKTHTQGGGLDKDYAFSWSYGISETFTYLIPDFYGGSSTSHLDKKSETYKTLVDRGVPRNNAEDFVKNISGYGGQLYWGEQPFTSGPAYMGAIVCFLFLLGLFIIQDPLKWWGLGITVFLTILSWGKHFFFSDIMFDYFPMYNKFRAVTMIHSIVAIILVFFAAWTVKEIVSGQVAKEKLVKGLKYATGSLAGLLLIFILFGSSILSFERVSETKDEKTSDEQFKETLPQMLQDKEFAANVYDSFIEDRIGLFRSDSIRSLILILLAASVIWAYTKMDFKPVYVSIALLVLILFDEWSISKRYLNNDDFVSQRSYKEKFQPSRADEMILSDTSYFRVMNTTLSTFNDASTSYFHNSVGGYHGAKLKRYQDIIDRYLSKGDMNILNMLNTKYFIVQRSQGEEPMAQLNPGALGNAWFVRAYKLVNTPDEEINALNGIKTDSLAIIDKTFSDRLTGLNNLQFDSSATIKLVNHKPKEMVYEANCKTPQLAVFSEIYYNSGLGWDAYIDGQLVPHLRTDYILRGLVIPAGKHKIEFKFEPRSYYLGEKISIACSLLLFLALGGLVYMQVKKGDGNEKV